MLLSEKYQFFIGVGFMDGNLLSESYHRSEIVEGHFAQLIFGAFDMFVVSVSMKNGMRLHREFASSST